MSKLRVGMPTLMELNSVEENLKLAKSLGFDFIELNLNMSYISVDETFRHELINYKKEYAIDFTLHFYDTIDISSKSRYYRNYLYTEFSEIGKYLENVVSRIVIHIDPGAYMTINSVKEYVFAADKDYVSRTLNTLQTIREVLETFNIGIVLENVAIHPFMEELYKTLNENDFEFCYDIGHNVIHGDYLYEKLLEKYQLNVRHMHMHNVYNKKDHQELSKGELYIPNFINYAKENNIDVVIEVKDIPNLKKSCALLLEYK